ncbi:MAG: AAA family ATPase [Burkholderiales bacterium]|nr:AAA family ATPase [Burkholderiales bacterium]
MTDLTSGLLTLLIIAGVAVWLWRRKRGEAAPADPPAAAPEPVPADPPALNTPAECVEAMKPAYEASAHPRDLQSDAAFQRGVELMAAPEAPLPVVTDYVIGPSGELATMAAAAIARRPDGAAVMPKLIGNTGSLSVWVLYYVLQAVAAHVRTPVIWRILLRAAEWWPRNPLLPGVLDAFIAHRLEAGEVPDLAAAFGDVNPDLAAVRAILARLAEPLSARFNGQLDEWEQTRVDVPFLQSVGRLMPTEAGDDGIVEHEAIREGLDAAEAAVLQNTPGSFLLVGESGVGKTAFMQLLARRLAPKGWVVFDASAADVQAGQTYMGELEGRLRQMFAALDVRRRVLWYVPRAHEMHYAGRHRYSPVSLLDMVLPMVDAGRLCIVGETTPRALEKLLAQRPRMRTAFKAVQIEPLAPPEALQLARTVVAATIAPGRPDVPHAVLAEALDLSRHYLGHNAQPGGLLELVQRARALAAGTGGGATEVTHRHLVLALAEISGLPGDVIDDDSGLDVAAMRARFESQVMGQPAAVECLVERVAMLKAGLTDPRRPVGVFLFAGPTGTGKTEVAKTLAEFLFGSADRMIRLDMSELQDPSAIGRIVGDGGEDSDAEALVHRIRKQPFSLVLLDEFEKANPRVWDLFLQVFDDGRLTDARGNLADFRHAIIILTSNLGATEHSGKSLGFSGGADTFSETQITRSIAATFRPEFVNRLDRVVVFRPLSRTVMRDILRKELRSVLERRGFRNREWAVEWEASAIEFLLDRGFTPDMGARPLRRAIEQYVLGPIATTIVEHRFPEGDQFLFVRSDGLGVQVEFVDPDASTAAPVEAVSTPVDGSHLGALVLQHGHRDDDLARLSEGLQAIDDELLSDAWRSRKSALLAAMSRADFWSDESRFGTLDRIEQMDRVEAGVEAARSLRRRLEPRPSQRSYPAAVLGSLAERLHLLRHALDDLAAERAGDVFIAIEPVGADSTAGDPDAWVRKLGGMYARWAQARGMRFQVLSDVAVRSVIQAHGGFGVHGILGPEAGLHVFETPDANGGFDRTTARVRVVPQPVRPRSGTQSILDQAKACFGAEPVTTPSVVRRYRSEPSPLIRDSVRGWRTGRFDQVMAGNFDLF